MEVKLISKIEHRFIPALSDKDKDALRAGKVIDVKQETADFLLLHKYVEVVKSVKPKVVKKTTNKTEVL